MTTPRQETLSRLASIRDLATQAKGHGARFRAMLEKPWPVREHSIAFDTYLTPDTILWLVNLASEGIERSGTLTLPSENAP